MSPQDTTPHPPEWLHSPHQVWPRVWTRALLMEHGWCSHVANYGEACDETN